MKALCVAEESAYRAFRERVLLEFKQEGSSATSLSYYENNAGLAFRTLREQVQAIRGWVRDNASRLLATEPNLEPLIRRTLSIPISVQLMAVPQPFYRYVLHLFMPTRVLCGRIREIFVQVKTYEGREYLHNTMFSRLLPRELEYFTPSIDFAFRHLDIPNREALIDLRRLDYGWLVASYGVGLRKLSDIARYANYGCWPLDGEFAKLLVSERIVQSEEEFNWLRYSRDSYHYRLVDQKAHLQEARRLLQVMRNNKISRERIAGVFRYPLSLFNSGRLVCNVAALNTAGVVDTTTVLEMMEDQLWRASTEKWSYILNVIGAHSPVDIRRFKCLLNSGRTPSVSLVLHLKYLGASIQGLESCQGLIIELSKYEEHRVPIAELDILTAAPYSLTIEQVSRCTVYLLDGERLSEYLSVLIRHGFRAVEDIIAFQACYRDVTANDLERWLTILGDRRVGVDVTVIVSWLSQARQGGNLSAYQYLLDAIDMSKFKHLQQALPLASMGRVILQFLVERKRLSSVKLLCKWYYKKAKGIQGLRPWGSEDDDYLLLLGDAYERNNFSVLIGNQTCIYEVLRERVSEKIGRFPFNSDEITQAEYHQAYAKMLVTERASLLPMLPTILDRTKGVLLRSIVRAAWGPPQLLQEQLEALSPLIDQLLAGRGPVSSKLTELETDAIAMLYRTSVDTIKNTWSKVIGREEDLSGLKPRRDYPMKWESAIHKIHAPLERNSLLAIKQAAIFAKLLTDKLKVEVTKDFDDTFKSLQPERLRDSARDPWSLAAHLGVLLVVGGRDTLITQWVSRDLEAVAEIADEGPQTFERIEQLGKLFSSTLPDALDEHANAFCEGFCPEDAISISACLVGKDQLDVTTVPQKQLESAIYQIRENVLAVCQRWIARELLKFSKKKSDNFNTSILAVVTKHPAAYFAKDAAHLCTRGNTEMWDEGRHSHLVVFDAAQRQLAGMALIYIESISEIHRTKKCLIIRAINPMDDMLSTHTVSSIVDEFLRVAIEIARDNGLAAVVFPDHKGMHLLSNQSSIEEDLKDRYINAKFDHGFDPGVHEFPNEHVVTLKVLRTVISNFYAYEHGRENVNTLYVVWQETPS